MNFNELIHHIQLDIFNEYFQNNKEHIDIYLFNYLKISHRFLINNQSIEKIQFYLKILLEYSWEKLNTGIWQNVKDIYRYFYAYACYFDVLVDCKILIETNNYQNIIKKCDLGILLGGPILEKEFNELITIINENFKDKKKTKESEDLYHSSKRIRSDDNFNWMSIPIIDSTKAIERIHCPSIEQFLRCYMQTKKPVILVGCIDHWPALKKWSFDYLIKLAGDRTVPIELGSRYSDDDWTQKLMTISDFVQQYCQQRSSKCGYLAQHPLLDQIPDLKKDICIPDYCYISTNENEDEEVDLNAWIGPKQTISPLHNDPKQNLLAQVVGEKYIRLYDPIYSSRLYALGSTMLNNTSSIDVEHPDYDRFPLFKDVPYLECILQPGDMLYIPSRHWHYVRSLSPSFSMNFTELFKVTSHQCSFSPNGQYLATVNQYRLIIRSLKTLEIHYLFSCIDTIDTIEWSYDSNLILAALIKRHVVQIFSLENPEWKCKIDEGSTGLSHVNWAPDSRHILTTAQFHLRITVWSLTSKNVSYIKYPKKLLPNSYIFSLTKPYMALVERRNDCTDHISIFNYEKNWSMIEHFQINELEDLQGIQWSPNENVLCLWENSYEYKIVFYSLNGNILNIYKPDDEQFGLGIRCARWSPTGQILVVGDYNEHITIFSYLTYKKIQQPFEYPQRLSSGQGYIILKEEEYHVDHEERKEKIQRVLYSSYIESKYIIYNGTLQISPTKPDLNRANPRLGVSSIEFSSSGRYISTINDTMPNLLFIFDLKPVFHLAYVLIQTKPIRCIKWELKRDYLALCTHNNRLYLWSPDGASCIKLPKESSKLNIDEIKWNNYHTIPSIALIGQNSMCVGFIDEIKNEL